MAKEEDSKIEELLRQLLTSNLAANDARKEEADRASDQRNKAEAKSDKKDKQASNQLKKADSSLTSLPVIGKMTKLISGTITATANKSLKLQEAALARGSSLGQAMTQNSKVTDRLGGVMGAQVGHMQAIQTNFEMFAGGLGDASFETSRLVHATRLSSGQQKQLIAGLAKNTRGMGFTSEETSRLADTTLGMAQKYGVSTNELVNAVGGLAAQLYDFAALGIGAGVQEAATVLAAGLGPAMAKVGPELIGAFTKGDSMIQASLLGVSAERAELLKQGGDHTKAAIGLVVKGGAAAERLINQWTSGGMDRGLALQQLTQIYGKETTQLLAARNELQANAKASGMTLAAYTKQMQKEAKIKEEWSNTWQNFKDKVVSPLQAVVMGFVNFGLKLISSFGWLIKPLAQLALGVGALMMAVIAMKKAFILWQVAQKGAGIVKGAIGAAGGGMKGIGGAVKDGFGKLKGFITGGGKGPAAAAAGATAGGAKAGGAMPGAPKGGGGLGGFLGGLGDGLKKLGTTGALKGAAVIAILAASLAIAAVGFGLFGNVDWGSIAKGTVALLVLTGVAAIMGKLAGQIIPGAGAIALLGLSLLPLAFAFNLIKDVGIGTMFAFAGALIVLALAAAGASFIAPFIIVGAAAFLILGIALIPLAVALRIAAPAMDIFMTSLIRFKDVPLMKILGFALLMPFLAMGLLSLAMISPALFILGVAMTMFITPFMKLIASLTWLNDVPIGKMFLLLPALMAITMGLMAMTAGGIIMAAVDGLMALFGVDSPIQKIVKMGEAAKHINKMAKTLKTLPNLLQQTVKAMSKIQLGPFYLLAHGLAIVKRAIDKFSVMDMMKFKMFGVQPKAQTTPAQKIQQKAKPRHDPQSWTTWPSQQRKKKEESWNFKSEGVGDLMFKSQEEMPVVDQARIDRKKGEIGELSGRAANLKEGGRPQAMVEKHVRILEQQLILLQNIYDKQEEGNEISVEGNDERREGNRESKGRPSDRVAPGTGVVGSLS